jgi:hypothetical protein
VAHGHWAAASALPPPLPLLPLPLLLLLLLERCHYQDSIGVRRVVRLAQQRRALHLPGRLLQQPAAQLAEPPADHLGDKAPALLGLRGRP